MKERGGGWSYGRRGEEDGGMEGEGRRKMSYVRKDITDEIA